MQRVITYIDGYNLYYGLRARNWQRFNWLNIPKMAGLLLKPGQVLVSVKYFTSIISQPADRHDRQAVYLGALHTLPNFHTHYGHYLEDTVTCQSCGHTYRVYHEKMTDVNIAVEMMTDAFQDRFDVALLVSADSDLVAPVRAVRQLFSQKRVVVAFPPARYSTALGHAGGKPLHISQSILAKSQFPDDVAGPDGFIFHRPREWR